MENKLFYQCAICDKMFDNVSDRAKCELECIKRIEEEAKKMEETKKRARKAAVDKAVIHAVQLIEEYEADYGEYEFEAESEEKSINEALLDGLVWLSLFM